MTDAAAIAGFVDKWRARWPEWEVARAFVPAARREAMDAWFALLQEFTDAAWDGDDPTPGAAKLAWWQEELQGWSRGARRHPLGAVLQAQALPWQPLIAALARLQATRERPRDADEADARLQAFAHVVAQCEGVLWLRKPDAADGCADTASVLVSLQGEQLLRHPAQAVPMQWLARHGEVGDPDAAARAWAVELRQRDTRAGNAAPRCIHAALMRARLSGFASSGNNVPVARWRIPFLAWSAARRHGPVRGPAS